MPAGRSSFADLGLRPVVVHALRRLGVEVPFPIQSAAIPDALAGKDVLGRAPTGAGKTLAFGLPLLQLLTGGSSRPARPRALVLVPTRELALQIESALEEPALALGIRISSVVGGVPLKRQIDRLLRGIDVVVATPGRLEDLAATSAISLVDVAITVIDEADRMSDLGFLPQVKKLLDRTPSDGQRMLFSATLDGDVDELVRSYLHAPVIHHSQHSDAAPARMHHHFLRVSVDDKPEVAIRIAARDGRTIAFLRTKHAVDRFTESLLAVGINAAALHGDKTQASRTRTVASFSDGSVSVLVATDVAARGLHVDNVSLVVHVDPPSDAKDYTHRAGRTARAGEAGTVVTLVTAAQESEVRALATEAGIEVDLTDIEPTSAALTVLTGARRPLGVAVQSQTDASRRDTSSDPKRRNGAAPRRSRDRNRRTGRR